MLTKEIVQQRQEFERNSVDKEKQLMVEKEMDKDKMQAQLLVKQKVCA